MLKLGEFISSEIGSINRPEYRHTRSLARQPPRAPARSARKPPMNTPPPKPAVNRSPNSTPILCRIFAEVSDEERRRPRAHRIVDE
jgi:hypothetical protein